MVNRLVSVDDTFTIPPAVKVADPNLPERLQNAALNATILSAIEEAGGVSGPVTDAANGIGEYQWIYPQALYVSALSPRTLVGYIGANRGDGRSDVGVVEFDHLRSTVRRVVIGDAPTDDHNVPAVQVLGNGKIVIALGGRGEANPNVMHIWTTDESGDLDTLGPKRTHNIGGSASYAHLHPDPADPASFFINGRRWQLDSPYDWYIAKVTTAVNESVTWGTIRSLLNSTVGRQPYVTSVAADISGQAGFRMALTDNPSNGSNVVCYGTVNLVTGAVASPGKAITANVLTGVGLPLTFEDFDQAYSAGEGDELRTFAVRSGGDAAILVADGDATNFSSDARYLELIRAESSDPGLHIKAATAYVSTPDHSKFHAPSLKIRVHATYATAALSKGLVRKYGSVDGQRTFQLTTISSGALRLVTYPAGSTTGAITTDSTVLPDPAAVGFGVEFTPNNGTNRVTTFWQTLDGTTWTQLGATVTAATTTLFWGTAPIEIGTATTSAIGTIRKVEFYNSAGGSTVVAGPNFTSPIEWPDGTDTGDSRQDASGSTWTIVGDAIVEGDGWQATDYGATGAALTPAAPSYVAAMAYPVPSRGAVKLRAKEEAGTWKVEKITSAGAVRELASSAVHKLARPIPVVGGGPFDVVYSRVTSYGGFSTFASDIVGV